MTTLLRQPCGVVGAPRPARLPHTHTHAHTRSPPFEKAALNPRRSTRPRPGPGTARAREEGRSRGGCSSPRTSPVRGSDLWGNSGGGSAPFSRRPRNARFRPRCQGPHSSRSPCLPPPEMCVCLCVWEREVGSPTQELPEKLLLVSFFFCLWNFGFKPLALLSTPSSPFSFSSVFCAKLQNKEKEGVDKGEGAGGEGGRETHPPSSHPLLVA